jgi:hypothetical protein
MARRVFVDADDPGAATGKARDGGTAHGAEPDNDCIERHDRMLKSCGSPALAMPQIGRLQPMGDRV